MLYYYLIRWLFQAVKFLFTTIVGTSLLAACGLLLFTCGGFSLLFTPTEETPTSIKVADLEAKGPGDKKWLEVTDGYVFWPLEQELVTKYEGSNTKETNSYYVPLVSKGALDRWTAVLEQNKQDLDKAIYPYDDCRVFLKMSPGEFKRAFPRGMPDDAISTPYKATGRVETFQSEESDVREGLQKQTQHFKPERMMLLESGEQPPTKGTFGCAMILALPFFIPLGIVLIRRVMAGKAAKQAPADSAAAYAPAPAAGYAPARPAAAYAPAPPAAAGGAYYFARGGQRLGPVSFQQLRAMAAAGQLAPNDSIWQQGMPNWVPASTVPNLFGR